MLFNSTIFCVGFLPAALAGFFLIGALGGGRPARLWLILASAVFYGWWSWKFLILLGALTVFNFVSATNINRLRRAHASRSRLILSLAIIINLLVLGYFKYSNFLISNLAAMTGSHFDLVYVILPLGISFFTFQKIAYLVDSFKGKVDSFHLEHFALFVFFFPQLISGPIVHHSEFIPQVRRASFGAWLPRSIAAGMGCFIVGMFKKVVLADSYGLISDPIFAAAQATSLPTFFEAWFGSVAYAFQIYFDFSGYTDMAIGLGLMFGVKLPENFAGPYRAASVIEFWRRWHMTLSRFLRDYVYFPLGGNRKGEPRRYLNIMATMLLGGLWHGASWTFVAWGGLHGLYLLVDHLWHKAFGARRRDGDGTAFCGVASRALVFVAVVVAWVLFRAPTFGTAKSMLLAMVGTNGFALPAGVVETLDLPSTWFQAAPVAPIFQAGAGFEVWTAVLLLALGFAIVMFGTLRQRLSKRRLELLVLLCAGFVIQAVAVGHRTTQFIYYQF
jgi:D-alanyl-lipoteichoic acid acyltransferase DltB (MBOAT superfamily)